MAEYISALDNYTLRQLGENGHVEYTWSNNVREKIVQYYFQLTRVKNKQQINNLSEILYDILIQLKGALKDKYQNHPEYVMAKTYLSLMYKMIGQTRDIVDGKGEYELTYMMIYTWFKICPELAFYAIDTCVLSDDGKHPYGSWKDIKYFCNYCKEQGLSKDHYLIHHAITVANKQLRQDFTNYESGVDEISLAAKWLPREKSEKFGWLFNSLATNYFSNYLTMSKNDQSLNRAILKCKTDYRKILSKLNAKLDTLQIKQCANTWSTIDFKNVTSISLTKQKTAFLNKKKDNKERYPDREDRVLCAKNFKDFVNNSISNNVEIKGKRVGLNDFTKQAIQIDKEHNVTEYKLLNAQWKNNSSQNAKLGKMIAMVDVSGSMNGDPLYAAIALGIRIAEKSALGKRVLTFSSRPTWVNLDGVDEFVDMVHVVRKAEWGMNTNFHAALQMILDAIIIAKMKPEEVEDLTLVILSDMQIDEADSKYSTMYENIRLKYSQAGIRVHGTPYKPPHILFWNLRSTSGFPTLSSQPNTSMMSGFSPALLNVFCDEGLEALQACTPWSNMEKVLSNKRYEVLEDKFNQLFPSIYSF
jgi:hypothetical protein